MSKVQIRLNISTSAGEEFKLAVGSHSPLWLVKQECERVTGEAPEVQVLCLLNDEQDEGTLLEDDAATVGESGIVDGSSLFLSFLTAQAASRRGHALCSLRGLDAAEAAAAAKEDAGERARRECRRWLEDDREHSARAQARERELRERELARVVGTPRPDTPPAVRSSGNLCPTARGLLRTRKSTAQAEHSFNGVIFDVQSDAPGFCQKARLEETQKDSQSGVWGSPCSTRNVSQACSPRERYHTVSVTNPRR